MEAFLNPLASTSILYVSGGTPVNKYPPVSLVDWVREKFFSAFDSVTVAPANGLSCWSTTVPRTEEDPVWPYAKLENNIDSKHTTANKTPLFLRRLSLFMGSSWGSLL